MSDTPAPKPDTAIKRHGCMSWVNDLPSDPLECDAARPRGSEEPNCAPEKKGDRK